MWTILGVIVGSLFISYQASRNAVIRYFFKKGLRFITYGEHGRSMAAQQHVDHTHKVVSVEYTHNDRKYHLQLPYDPSQRSRSINKKVYLRANNGTTREITQFPGIAYLMTAKQMGGYEIEIYDEDTGEINTLAAEEKIL